MRRVLRAGLVLLLAGLVALVPFGIAHANALVTVSVPNGLPLNVRSAPSVNAGVVASLPNGSQVTITCHTRGDAVDGIGGVTDVWNQLPDGGWVTDGFLETGSNAPVVPACSGGGGEFKLPYPAGSAYTITQTPGSGFSHDDDYNRHAVDFGMPTGTPVVASAGGTVYFEGWTNGGGIMALIDHGNNRCSQYAHLNTTIINAGDWVAQGQQIGTSGATGNVTGPHLHWNIVYCDSQISREIPNSVEMGTNYPTGTAPVSQNG
ncbi:murein DD-endopeptidase MepM/ murein hydrolase activator NlpD [Stackebrandtia endophytica]|uniref:Murein DD-endopeptidase MepM/ murein hydrolase activator NlpD n=1 Tax=Stackebrandtia endophytica TaxID=1496996 RepID=A0A543ARX8_9ACTN|nr:M23 family metallopeptidase [Stackebrandtia endophytica]TQL75334.1 murein DD-endopeptidase MepM/ murein hydrolase activator NlpD [Stackebrandtia endophytica]